MSKMLVTALIPIVVLIGLTGSDFIADIGSYRDAIEIRSAISFSTELGMFLRYLQRERDMSALYVSAIGPETKAFLLRRYPETDFAIENLSAWPVRTGNKRHEFQTRDRFMTFLNRHRYQLDTTTRTAQDEIIFYTDLIEIFIGWLYDAISEARSGSIWKSLVAYQEIIVASEYIGRERGLGVTFYALGGFKTRDDYLLFVEAQDIANVTFTSCRRYSQIAFDVYDTEVRKKEEILRPIRDMRYQIRSNNSSAPNGSLEMADWWFENMSIYQDIVRDAQKKIALNLDRILEQRALEDLRSIILISCIFGAILVICPIIILAVYYLTSQIQKYSINIANRTKDLKKEKQRTDTLLYQMLPKSIAEKLKMNEQVAAEQFPQATIFFSDIVGFTQISSQSSPLQVVDMLNSLYLCFDRRIEMYDVYKVETIGDAYMVVSGVPRQNGVRHAAEIGTMALDLVRRVRRMDIPHQPGTKFKLRIGCHSGPVVAGVVGSKMPRYCLFGETVSVASKMESLGKANKVHISESTYELLAPLGEFTVEERTDGLAKFNRSAMPKEPILVAAIDFGTTFSGYAFSFRHEYQRDPLKISANNWIAGSQALISLKTPTTILLKSDQTFHSFGYEAENEYSILAENGEHAGWYYFRRFKMLLHQNKSLKRTTTIKDVNDKEMPAQTIFTLAIKYLKDHLMTSIHQRVVGMDDDLIRWVVTVPAIWDEGAKQFMREAAVKAGIKTNQLFLALEPEAASIYCNHVPLEMQSSTKGKLEASTFKPGVKYMVLDLGGGTADITVHEVRGNNSLREIHKATGGAWGGTKVDSAFYQFLVKLFGNDVLIELKDKCMDDYLGIIRDFETKKRTIKPDMEGKIAIKVPFQLFEIFKTHSEETLAEALPNTSFSKSVALRADKLVIQCEIFKQFFTDAVDGIVDHVKDILKQFEETEIKKVLLVGGFSESPMVLQKLKSVLPNQRIIAPQDPGLAVLKGAVLFGHDPTVISSRISRYTYGFELKMPFERGVHPEIYKVVDKGKTFCNYVFDVCVNVGDEVPIGHTVKRTYIPDEDDARYGLPLYRTGNRSPTFTRSGATEKLGAVKIRMPNGGWPEESRLHVVMEFGWTEITRATTVTAKDEHGEDLKQDHGAVAIAEYTYITETTDNTPNTTDYTTKTAENTSKTTDNTTKTTDNTTKTTYNTGKITDNTGKTSQIKKSNKYGRHVHTRGVARQY
ncbi:hypothetical protein FSP39_008541 [Pinctada imbricata]|uniref:guanylate cyclase n=1 Tax=Pinctada imbricata TaxID=66713 RepID=A0AA88YHW6_PINIB|nr:hypothetical protein FSP39_008541 [Pinctada imbricata]